MSKKSWKFDRSVVDQVGMPCIVSGPSRLVVAVAVDDGIDDDERDANGYLLAAAPDLLAALQAIVASDEEAIHELARMALPAPSEDLTNIARAAISKALGKGGGA